MVAEAGGGGAAQAQSASVGSSIHQPGSRSLLVLDSCSGGRGACCPAPWPLLPAWGRAGLQPGRAAPAGAIMGSPSTFSSGQESGQLGPGSSSWLGETHPTPQVPSCRAGPWAAYLGMGWDVGTTGTNLGQLAICSRTFRQEVTCMRILARVTWETGRAGLSHGARWRRRPGG